MWTASSKVLPPPGGLLENFKWLVASKVFLDRLPKWEAMGLTKLTISHVGKVMLKTFQAKLQLYMNRELLDV